MLPEAEISLARALLDGEALELADLLHAASDRSHPSRSLREVLVDERYVTLAEVEEAERRLSDSTFDSRFHTVRRTSKENLFRQKRTDKHRNSSGRDRRGEIFTFKSSPIALSSALLFLIILLAQKHEVRMAP